MRVVSNASPLINLARIGRLDLLVQLYGELTIPDAVWHEVVVQGTGQAGAAEIERAGWIRAQPVANRALVRALQQELDAGEAEAIALALEVGADLLLMDERLGRETASYMGVRCLGLIGVCVEAKQRGILTYIRPLLDQLREAAGFRIGPELVRRVLSDAGEGEGSA